MTTMAAIENGTGSPRQVDVLLKDAEKLIDSFKYEVALEYLRLALDKEPENVKALETSAGLLVELGDLDEAKERLKKAIDKAPEDGYRKYMSMAQLEEGKEAIELYKKGINVLLKNMDSLDEAECKSTSRDLSSAYCAIAEIYMTDCCFDDDAESDCRSNIEKAIQIDPLNAEAYHCMANFKMVKDEREDAGDMIKKSLSLWLPKMLAVMEGKEAADDPVEICEVSSSVRISTAKILIELEEYDLASDVLESLAAEDDQVVEVWYLLGYMNFLQGEDYTTNAKFYLKQALKVSKKVGDMDEDVVSQINDLLTEMGVSLEDVEKEESSESSDDNYSDVESTDEEESMDV